MYGSVICLAGVPERPASHGRFWCSKSGCTFDGSTGLEHSLGKLSQQVTVERAKESRDRNTQVQKCRECIHRH